MSPTVVPPAAMFTGPAERSPWPARLAVAAITIVIIGAAGYVLVPRGDGAVAQTSQTAAAGQVPPLELLSLRHSQEVGALVITGLVQNPRAGAAAHARHRDGVSLRR